MPPERSHVRKTLPLSPGLRVTAMGLGRFGGQLAAIRYLAQQKARLLITDQADPETLRPSLTQLHDFPELQFRWGPHQRDDFRDTDLILVSPAVPPHHPCLQTAAEAGIPILTEIELFLAECPAPVIAVSGTVGKSTTATMISQILTAAGQTVHLGGNLGHSLLPELEQIRPSSWVVLELSSFQLHWLRRHPPRFQIAVLTHYAPHHLEWHGSEAEYRRCKQVLFMQQQPDDLRILPADAHTHPAWQGPGKCVTPSSDLEQHWAEILQAPHLGRNAALAERVAQELNIPAEITEAALRTHTGLPHRRELIGERNGRRFWNDSKATSPFATQAALQALQRPTWLLLGGAPTSDDPQQMLEEIARQPLLRGVACFGPMGKQWGTLPQLTSSRWPCQTFETLEPALQWCWQQSQPGDDLLLSPACPSYDEFLNYEQRGHFLRTLMQQM